MAYVQWYTSYLIFKFWEFNGKLRQEGLGGNILRNNQQEKIKTNRPGLSHIQNRLVSHHHIPMGRITIISLSSPPHHPPPRLLLHHESNHIPNIGQHHPHLLLHHILIWVHRLHHKHHPHIVHPPQHNLQSERVRRVQIHPGLAREQIVPRCEVHAVVELGDCCLLPDKKCVCEHIPVHFSILQRSHHLHLPEL